MSNNSTNSTLPGVPEEDPAVDMLDDNATAAERGESVEGDLQEAFGTDNMNGKEMFMWYAVYALI